MPEQHYKRKASVGLNRTPRQMLPVPGEGGYNYPRGPYGKTGFPGSTPASRRTHTQDGTGRKDPSDRGIPKITISGQQDQWERLPARRSYAGSYIGGEGGVLEDSDLTEPRPKRPTTIRELIGFLAGRQVQPPARVKKRTTGPERRATPHIGANAPGSQNVRNTYARRYKADPALWRSYRPSPNPGKTGAQFDAPARYHPDTTVHGHPDGKPVPGQPPNAGPVVFVQSRFVSAEGAQEDYAMDRPMLFAKGGPPPAIPPGAAPHIRGGRYSGQRYFGELGDQQQIGLDTDAYGISRRRGPRHRPVRFEMPAPHTANYYDVPPDEGTQAPDVIHRSQPVQRQAGRAPLRAGGAVRKTSKPPRGGGGGARTARPSVGGRPRRG